MEHLAKRLADYICEKEIITEEMTEIYQYGFQCFLELSVSTVCSIIIALFLGMLPECLFFFLLFIPMRSYGGGLHMKTYFACFIGSCLILTASLLAVKYLQSPFRSLLRCICLLPYLSCSSVRLTIQIGK